MFIKFDLNYIFIPIVSGIMIFLPYILSVIGLSSIGPIAGGLFASMQGSAIVGGSIMAMMQSFAMSGWVVVIQIITICFWIMVSIFTFIKKLFYNKN